MTPANTGYIDYHALSIQIVYGAQFRGHRLKHPQQIKPSNERTNQPGSFTVFQCLDCGKLAYLSEIPFPDYPYVVCYGDLFLSPCNPHHS